MTSVVEVRDVDHRYGVRQALSNVTFSVEPGEIFGLLGQNGGGKTTLFRLLCTLMPLQSGQMTVGGYDVVDAAPAVRRAIGVTFQSPSLDGKLTVRENLRAQGMLYGLSRAVLKERIDWATGALGIADRRDDRADSLSGGLKRRAEIAKSLLHRPSVLLLDEPSTGLDPGARHDLWRLLGDLQADGMTILVTTHLMEEADKCHRLGILHLGDLVALGTPAELRSSLGGDCLTLRVRDSLAVMDCLESEWGLAPTRVDDCVRVEDAEGLELLSRLLERFPEQIESATVGKPTLEDVFISRTGHRFWDVDTVPL